MNSIPAVAPRLGLTLALFLSVFSGVVQADAIDLSLNVFYNDDTNPSSGGTWQVAAKTDESGLLDVFFYLRDINPTGILNLAPNGTVNGGNIAGFQPIVANHSTYVNLGFYQASAAAPATEQTHFYGVGSIVDPEGATPNYTDQATDFPNASAIGPVRTTLENLNNPLWGDGDDLGDPDWDQAAVLASGTFAAGQSPAFYSTAAQMPQGHVFVNAPSGATDIGASSDLITPSTIVRSNLTVPTADFGDYNEDGIVDLADYTVWRNTLGLAVSPVGSAADGDQSGVIDAGDYTVWKNNFGLAATPIVAAPISSAAVPEPQTVTLLAFTAIAALITRRRRRV